MSKHTLGPWNADIATDGWFIMNHLNYMVAEVPNINGKTENEANAQLIAAAPELLEALKLLGILEDFSVPVKPGDVMEMPQDVTLINEAYAKAYAAIAKAEGK